MGATTAAWTVATSAKRLAILGAAWKACSKVAKLVARLAVSKVAKSDLGLVASSVGLTGLS